MTPNVAIDTNILAYFIEVIEPQYNHLEDLEGNIKPQRLAILRCFMYRPPYYVPPSVKNEYLKTKEPNLRNLFRTSHQVLFLDIVPSPPSAQVIALKNEYMKKHRKDMDCQILSEAEVGGMNIFLTFDEKFYKRLKDNTKTIKIMYPTEYLKTLNIQKGTKPAHEPAQSNPLFNKQNLWRI